jgi:hypothetical protein
MLLLIDHNTTPQMNAFFEIGPKFGLKSIFMGLRKKILRKFSGLFLAEKLRFVESDHFCSTALLRTYKQFRIIETIKAQNTFFSSVRRKGWHHT